MYKRSIKDVIDNERSIIDNINNNIISLKNNGESINNELLVLKQLVQNNDTKYTDIETKINELTTNIASLNDAIMSYENQLNNNLLITNELLKTLAQNSNIVQPLLYGQNVEPILLRSTVPSQLLSLPTVLNYGLINNNEFIFMVTNRTLKINYSVSADNRIYLGSIGGGGGGGGGRDGDSPGGGGGGGIAFIYNSVYDAGTTFNVTTGSPGLGGGSGKSGETGKVSSIIGSIYSSLSISSNGGQGGSTSAGGKGGTCVAQNYNGSMYYAIGGNGGDQSAGYSALVQQNFNPIYSDILSLGIIYCTSIFCGGGGGSHSGNEAYPYFGGSAGSTVGGKRGYSIPTNGDSPEGPGTFFGNSALLCGCGGGAGGQVPEGLSVGELYTGETLDNIYYSGGIGGWGMNFAGIKRLNNFEGYFDYVSKKIKYYETASYYVWCVLEGTFSFIAPYDIDADTNLSVLLVGGGGGGGASDGGVSSGGGTGGGVVFLPNITLSTNNLLVGLVGIGGTEGVVGTQSGRIGMPTYLTKCAATGSSAWNAIAMGGMSGNRESAGIVNVNPIEMTPAFTSVNGGYSIRNIPNDPNNPNLGLYGGNGGDQSNGLAGCLSVFGDVNSRTKIPFPSELLNLNIPEIKEYYCGGGGGSKANNEDSSYNGGSSGDSYGNGGIRGKKDGSGPYEGQNGVGYGSGGGAGGCKKSTEYRGGKGGDGLIVIYMRKYVL